jgi:hypothetical protein
MFDLSDRLLAQHVKHHFVFNADNLGMNQLNVNGLKNGRRNVMMTVKQAIGSLLIPKNVQSAMLLSVRRILIVLRPNKKLVTAASLGLKCGTRKPFER